MTTTTEHSKLEPGQFLVQWTDLAGTHREIHNDLDNCSDLRNYPESIGSLAVLDHTGRQVWFWLKQSLIRPNTMKNPRHTTDSEPVFTLSEVRTLAEELISQLSSASELRIRSAFERMGVVLDPSDRYRLEAGGVQCFVSGWKAGCPLHHFGPAQYDRHLPVLTDSILKLAQPIIDALNLGSISEDLARKRLDRI